MGSVVALLIVSLIVTMIRSALCDDRDRSPGLAGRGGDHVVGAPMDGRNTAVLELQSGATAVHIGVPKRVVGQAPVLPELNACCEPIGLPLLTPQLQCIDHSIRKRNDPQRSRCLGARGGSLRLGGIAAPAAQLEHVDQDQYRARQARFSSATQWPALARRRTNQIRLGVRCRPRSQLAMTCLFNNPAQFMTITLGVSSASFAYDLAALSVVWDKPEALAGSYGRWPGDDRPGRGLHTLPVRQHQSRASSGRRFVHCLLTCAGSVRDRFSPAHSGIRSRLQRRPFPIE